MKKLNISVDLDNNEIFQESIRDALKSQAKQISRETLSQLMESEIERIVKNKVDQLSDTTSYYNPIVKNITDLVAKRLETDINYNTESIDKIIEDKIAKYLDEKMKKLYGSPDIEKFIQSYLDRSVAMALMNRNK